MAGRPRISAGVAFAVAALLALPATSAAQLRVILSGGFSAPYGELLPEFERTTGITVTTTRGGSIGGSPNTIPNQIRRGVPADVVILAREGLSQIIAEGAIVAGTDVDLASSVLGMIVREGTPIPDISTVEGLREALLGAESVSLSTSTSGTYLTTQLFPRLGIADQMAPKTLTGGAAAVGRGEATMGLQNVSEVLPVPNSEFVGAFPQEVQYTTTYAAAVVRGSTEVDAARRLIAFLASADASAVIVRSGMEPGGQR